MQKPVTAGQRRASQRRSGQTDSPAETFCRGLRGNRAHWAADTEQIEGSGLAGVNGGDDLLAVLEALVRVFIQQLVQQRLETAQRRRQFRHRRGDVHHRQGKAVVGGVRYVAGEHFVEQHAETV